MRALTAANCALVLGCSAAPHAAVKVDEMNFETYRAYGRQVRALTASDRVLVLGCSAAPHAAVKKDEAALLGLFDKHLPVPLPDYAARRVSSRVGGPGKQAPTRSVGNHWRMHLRDKFTRMHGCHLSRAGQAAAASMADGRMLRAHSSKHSVRPALKQADKAGASKHRCLPACAAHGRV